MKKTPLGRGLGALLDDNSTQRPEIMNIRVSQISPNREQPRKNFDPAAMDELVESVKQHGVISPILVNESSGGYTIIAGERRWRAAREAGLSEIPAVICDYDKMQTAQIALIENLQREDLNPVEEAFGYKHLIESFGLTQEDVALRVGKARSSVANTLRLLNLPESALSLLRDGKISTGHAKVLLNVKDSGLLIKAARAACDRAMSVRELEGYIKSLGSVPPAAGEKKKTPPRDRFYEEFEIAAKNGIGRRVKVVGEPKGKKPGRLEIEFYSKEDLTAFINALAKNK